MTVERTTPTPSDFATIATPARYRHHDNIGGDVRHIRPGSATTHWSMSMSNPNGVSLDVRNFPTSGNGWTNTTASNGATYSYRYTGGDANTNNGTVTCTTGHGNASINLSLTADSRYEIGTVSFTGDNADQLSTQGNAPRSRVINDRNTQDINANYKVNVIDTGNGNASIPCDPQIVNKPSMA